MSDTHNDSGPDSGGELPELVNRLVRLRRLRLVPDEVLAEIVAADGLVRRPADAPELAAASGAGDADRELAARLCAGCPVQEECLELDLRWLADRTVGVFAGLTDTDRRAVYRLWAAERAGPTDDLPAPAEART